MRSVAGKGSGSGKPAAEAAPPARRKQGRESQKGAKARRQTAGQKRLMETMLKPEFRLQTIKNITADAHVGRNAYYNAIKNPAFLEELNRRSRELVGPAVPAAMHALLEQAKLGNVQAILVVMDMMGIYTKSGKFPKDRTPPPQPEIPGLREMLKEMGSDELQKLAQ